MKFSWFTDLLKSHSCLEVRESLSSIAPCICFYCYIITYIHTFLFSFPSGSMKVEQKLHPCSLQNRNWNLNGKTSFLVFLCKHWVWYLSLGHYFCVIKQEIRCHCHMSKTRPQDQEAISDLSQNFNI